MKYNLPLRRFFASLLLLAVSTLSWAYNFEVDGIYYSVTSARGRTVAVTYRNSSYNSYSGSVAIPSTVTHSTQTYNVTSIDYSAFRDCSGLTSVTIPESVTSIDSYVFSGCSGLTSVTIPESVTSIGDYAFSGCSGLTSITIPNSVTSIGGYVFQNCSGLTSVTIGKSVTRIGEYPFSGCSVLTSIKVALDNTKYDSRNNCNAIIEKASNTLVYGCMNTIIPEDVTSIGGYAFCNCSGLTSITIPESVTGIGSAAFEYCPNLTSVTLNSSTIVSSSMKSIFGVQVKEYIIGDNVTSIGDGAFYGCSGLKSVTIPEGVTSIGDNAFQSCSGLTSINIPKSVTNIGGLAFYNCSALTSVIIPESVTCIYAYTFKGCSSLTSIIVPNNVTIIADQAFCGCLNLTSFTIGSGVTTIGQNVFKDCSNLSSLTILCQNAGSWFKGVTTLKDLVLGNGVESIADEAFSGCSDLTTITIGSGIKTIGTRAFANCGNIYDVYCYAMRYPTTSSDAFENSYPDYITLHVPDESVDNYKAVAPWNTFKKVIGVSSDSGREACEKPVITYKDGKLEATSETEGAQCVIIISDEDINTHFNSVNLTATYHISAYATKPNFKNSEIVTATLCWIDQEPETEGLINDVAEVRALPVLIQSEGGVISVNGVDSGTEVRVYAVNGTMAGSAAATDNSAQIDTNLLPGSIAIVKIGEKSVKIVMK